MVTFKTPDPTAEAPASPSIVGPSILRRSPRGILKSSQPASAAPPSPSMRPPAHTRLLPRTTRKRSNSEAETPSSSLDTQEATAEGNSPHRTTDSPATTAIKDWIRSKPDPSVTPLPIMNSVNDKNISDTMDRMRGYLVDLDEDFQKISSKISKGIVKGFKSSFGNRYKGRCTEDERVQYIALWVELAGRHNSGLTSEEQEFLIEIPKEDKKDDEVIVVDSSSGSSDSGASTIDATPFAGWGN